MISLGTRILSDHLLLDGVFTMPLTVSSTTITLGGCVVHQSIEQTGGQKLELYDPGDGLGHFTGADLRAINEYRRTAEPVDFIHHIGSWRVIVIGVDVQQSIKYNDPIDADGYAGTVTLLII